jgi:hypothetical protein
MVDGPPDSDTCAGTENIERHPRSSDQTTEELLCYRSDGAQSYDDVAQRGALLLAL